MHEFNKAYLDGIKKGEIHHPFYDKTVTHAQEMGVHVEGETPEFLLNINRPNEQADIKQYRLDTYQAVTQSLSEKVVNTVNKIFNPRLWDLDFPEQGGSNTLAQYLTEDYPDYRSLMNFITETFTTKDFSDPNGAIVVMPQSFNIEETELFEPVAIIYTAESLVDYGDHYYTFLFGDVVKIFTDTQIQYYINIKDKWELFWEYTHDLGFVPVFRLGGIIKGKKEPFYFESWIRGVLPHWNQVVQLTSDLQAAYVNHLFMEKWEIETECQAANCKGGSIKTKITNGPEKGEWIEVNCSDCKGTGRVSKSPFGIHTVNRDAINPDNPLPTPPMGYADKPIEIVDKVEDRIAKEEKRGLASINMEIVQMVGTDQSGIAKTVDREDLNAFLTRYSRHVFEYVLPNLIRMIAAWRYGITDTIENIIPVINQPKDFNILGLKELSTEYKDATNAKVSDGYLQHIELELVQSKFANNDESRKLNDALIKLNPYPGKSVDDMLTLQNLGEQEWTIYKAIHLIELVNDAIDEDKTFLDKPLKAQREVIDKLAKDAVGFEEDAEVITPQPPPINPVIIPPVEPIIDPLIEEDN